MKKYLKSYKNHGPALKISFTAQTIKKTEVFGWELPTPLDSMIQKSSQRKNKC